MEPTRERTPSEDYAIKQQEVNKARRQDMRGKALAGPTVATSGVAHGVLKRGEWESEWSAVGKNITAYERLGKLPHGISQLFNKYNELFISCGYDKASPAAHMEKHEVRQELLKEIAAAKGLESNDAAEMEVIKNHLLAENEEFVGKIIGEKYGGQVEALYDSYDLAISSPNRYRDDQARIIVNGLTLLNTIELIQSNIPNQRVDEKEFEFIKNTILQRLERETPYKPLDRFGQQQERTPEQEGQRVFQRLLHTHNEALWNAGWELFNNHARVEYSTENTEFLYLCHMQDQLASGQPLSDLQKGKISKMFAERDRQSRKVENRGIGELTGDVETFAQKIQETYIDTEVVNLKSDQKQKTMAKFTEKSPDELRRSIENHPKLMPEVISDAKNKLKEELQPEVEEIEVRVRQELESQATENESPEVLQRKIKARVNTELEQLFQTPEMRPRLQVHVQKELDRAVAAATNEQDQLMKFRDAHSNSQKVAIAREAIDTLFAADPSKRMVKRYMHVAGQEAPKAEEFVKMNACLFVDEQLRLPGPPALPLPPASVSPGTPTTTPPPSPLLTGNPPPFEEAA